MSRIERSNEIYNIYDFLSSRCVNCKIYKFNDFSSLPSANFTNLSLRAEYLPSSPAN